MKTQFITDDQGKKLAIILPIKEYQNIINCLEELEDIKLYDEAKKEDTGERVLLYDYLGKRNARNG